MTRWLPVLLSFASASVGAQPVTRSDLESVLLRTVDTVRAIASDHNSAASSSRMRVDRQIIRDKAAKNLAVTFDRQAPPVNRTEIGDYSFQEVSSCLRQSIRSPRACYDPGESYLTVTTLKEIAGDT